MEQVTGHGRPTDRDHSGQVQWHGRLRHSDDDADDRLVFRLDRSSRFVGVGTVERGDRSMHDGDRLGGGNSQHHSRRSYGQSINQSVLNF